MALAVVRQYEERLFNSWPAIEVQFVDGWLLRYANGYTKRSNSINAVYANQPDLNVVLEAGRRFYTERDQPLIFRMTPLSPEGADLELASRGFRRFDEACVMAAGSLSSGPADKWDHDFEVALTLSATWIEGFAAANEVPPHLKSATVALLNGILLPCAFGTLREDGKPVAYGLAVLDRGCAGLFDIVTVSSERRRGWGKRMVASMLNWSQQAGATSAWLSVVANNAPALALYRHFGFTELYRYHYRILP